MSKNVYTGQLVGPFKANEELYNKVIANAAIEEYKILFIKHLGVQSDIPTFVYINNEEIEIGKTGIYEIGNTKVTSIRFKADRDKNTIIDYVLEIDTYE